MNQTKLLNNNIPYHTHSPNHVHNNNKNNNIPQTTYSFINNKVSI